METVDFISELFVDVYDSFLQFFHSGSFAWVKFLFGVYVVVIFADIILLIIQRGLSGDLADTRYGMNVPPELIKGGPRKKLAAKWGKIRRRLAAGDERQYKIAVLEADRLIDDLIFRMGYKDGETFGERIENIPDGQIEDLPSIKEAHAVVNQVVLDERFELNREAAQKVLEGFEKFLITHEVLESPES